MKHEYVKYREFIREFKSFLELAHQDTIYELVGRKGETVGFFTLNDPRK